MYDDGAISEPFIYFTFMNLKFNIKIHKSLFFEKWKFEKEIRFNDFENTLRKMYVAFVEY